MSSVALRPQIELGRCILREAGIVEEDLEELINRDGCGARAESCFCAITIPNADGLVDVDAIYCNQMFSECI